MYCQKIEKNKIIISILLAKSYRLNKIKCCISKKTQKLISRHRAGGRGSDLEKFAEKTQALSTVD